MEIVVALGANLGNRAETFSQAIKEISNRIGVVKAVSKFIETKALVLPGSDPQPDYLNGVVVVETSRTPLEALDILLHIEQGLGRIRGLTELRWQPRTLDLDLICAENLVINSEKLTLPHPELHKRRFVLEPLLEVAPKWRHPILDKTVEEMLVELS